MSKSYSLEELADSVQVWCEEHRVLPANGQSADTITERTIRYYRTIGLLDAPLGGYVKSFTEKHRLQLLAIRLYQALGLPLRKIREELYGKSEEMLRELIRKPARRKIHPLDAFASPAAAEQWTVVPLTEEYLLVSRQGRSLPPDVLRRLKEALGPTQSKPATDVRKN
ncbi:MAG: MerR family transcriptional regulator [Verrucomicrobiota bacterium]